LMYPIGKMLSQVPQGQIMPYLEQILTPHLLALQEMASQEPSVAAKPRLIFIFKLLTSLFQSLDISKDQEHPPPERARNQSQPLTVLYPQLMPYIKGISMKWTLDIDVMDAVWTFVKQVTTCLAEFVKPFTQETVELIIQCYNVQPHETVLELARTYYLLLRREPECSAILSALFASLIGKSLQYVQETGNLSDNSELISSFYSVHSSIMKKDMKFFETEVIPLRQMLHCATACMAMPEVASVKHAASFISNFIIVSRESQCLVSIANDMGEGIFRQVILCVGGPSSNKGFIDYFADVLLALNKKYFDNLCTFMNGLVKEDGFPTDKITSEQKHRYAQMILKERTNKRKLLEIVREMSLVCAGMAVSEDMNKVMAAWDRIDSKQCSGLPELE